MSIIAIDIGIRNLGFCRMIASGASVILQDVGTVELVDETANVSRMSMESIVDCICSGFDSLCVRFIPETGRARSTVQPVKIVIEEQPTRIGRRIGNIKMKVVSHVLQALFKRQFPLTEIVFVHAAVKFTEMPTTVDRSDYRARKRFGIAMAQALVASSRIQDPGGILASKIQTHPKADDLCDAVLLGFYGRDATSAPRPTAPRTPKRKRRVKRRRLQPLEAPALSSDVSERE